MSTRMVSASARDKFRKIISQLDKVRSDSGVLKIIEQASNILVNNDADWEAVGIHVLRDYVPPSERRRAARAATKANGAAPVTVITLEKHALLKKAIMRHTSWPMVRDTLSMDIATATLEDLVSVAQLMGLDEKFVGMFAQFVSKPVDPQMDIEDFIAGKTHN